MSDNDSEDVFDQNSVLSHAKMPGQKPTPGLRRNSFSATELSTFHSFGHHPHNADEPTAVFDFLPTRKNAFFARNDSLESLSEPNFCRYCENANASKCSACAAKTESDVLFYLGSSSAAEEDGRAAAPPDHNDAEITQYSNSHLLHMENGVSKQNCNTRLHESCSCDYTRKTSEPVAQSPLLYPHKFFDAPHPVSHSTGNVSPTYHRSHSSQSDRHHQTESDSMLRMVQKRRFNQHRHHYQRSEVRLSAYDNHIFKLSYTEKVLNANESIKGMLSHMQGLLQSAFVLLDAKNTERSIIEGASIAEMVLYKAWATPKIGHDLADGLCDYIRETQDYFVRLLFLFSTVDTSYKVRLCCGRVLEKCLNDSNRAYLVEAEMLDEFVKAIQALKDTAGRRVGVSLLSSLFDDKAEISFRLIKLLALDYVLDACKASPDDQITCRQAASALLNLSMRGDTACQQAMLAKNVPEWLFLLGSDNDDVTRYYACLSICALVSNKEVETAVIKSGTLNIVEPFLQSHRPSVFAQCDYRYTTGRPTEWLRLLMPMLGGKRKEPRSAASFHFALEAVIRKEHNELNVFEELGVVEALKRVAALPEEVAPKFASLALQIVGESVPYKLSQRVAEWTVEDVQYWVLKTGFAEYSDAFGQHRVDGDLLLLLTEEDLVGDIGMTSGLLRKRFMRELDSLKVVADYRNIDESKLDSFLVSVHPRFSVYTYRMLRMNVDRSSLQFLDERALKNDFYITNPVHRAKLLHALDAEISIDDVELELLSKKIDIFISYRRSTGNQLASLIKVLLQLRNYKVFIDVERLSSGQFDSSLFKNIQAAKHFVLVLSPGSLDRCVGDEACNDWIHKEVVCALASNKNIIPVFDTNFVFPDDNVLPADMRPITKFNGLHWVHEYQDACVDKLEKFINGELVDHTVSPFIRRRSGSRLTLANPNGSLTPSVSTSDLLSIIDKRTKPTPPDIIINYCG